MRAFVLLAPLLALLLAPASPAVGATVCDPDQQVYATGSYYVVWDPDAGSWYWYEESNGMVGVQRGGMSITQPGEHDDCFDGATPDALLFVARARLGPFT